MVTLIRFLLDLHLKLHLKLNKIEDGIILWLYFSVTAVERVNNLRGLLALGLCSAFSALF